MRESTWDVRIWRIWRLKTVPALKGSTLYLGARHTTIIVFYLSIFYLNVRHVPFTPPTKRISIGHGLTIVQLNNNLFVFIFNSFEAGIAEQIPASNEWKINILMKNRQIANWIIRWTEHPSQTFLAFSVILYFKVIYHPLYSMNNFMTNQSFHKMGHKCFLIWGAWLSCPYKDVIIHTI